MNAGQYEGIMGALREILDRMPEGPPPVVKPLVTHHLDGTVTLGGEKAVRTGWPYERPGPAPVASISRDLDGAVTKTLADPLPAGAASCRRTLGVVLRTLDFWIEGAKENHEAMQHRGENIGSECWRSFAPDDIRNMINDAATELGLATFPVPPHPEEEKAL